MAVVVVSRVETFEDRGSRYVPNRFETITKTGTWSKGVGGRENNKNESNHKPADTASIQNVINHHTGEPVLYIMIINAYYKHVYIFNTHIYIFYYIYYVSCNDVMRRACALGDVAVVEWNSDGNRRYSGR